MVSAALACTYALARVTIPTTHRLPVETFPQQIGGWTAEPDLPVDDYVQKKLPTAKIVTRDYTGASGQKVQLLLLSAARRQDFHNPNECFPGAGWQLSDKYPIQIDGQTVNTMRAEREGVKTLVWYWWAGELDFEKGANGQQSHIQRLRKSILTTLGRYDGVSLFVRMMAPDTEPGRAELTAFTRTLLPAIHQLWNGVNAPHTLGATASR